MFSNISIDITRFDGDVVVNSLGIGRRLSVPGMLFRSILKECEDKEDLMDEVLDKGRDLSFGDIFLTSSYGLPFKEIIHVITPFYKDDISLEKIKKCYEDVLELALKRGYSSICLPLIGTGANGYPLDDTAMVARKTCYLFALKHPEMDVYFNVYSVEIAPRREESIQFYKAPPFEYKGEHTLLDEAKVERGDSFAAVIRKIVFLKTIGTKDKKEQVLSEMWVGIDSLVANSKNKNHEIVVQAGNHIHKVHIGEEKLNMALFDEAPNSHSPKYEWKKCKTSKGKDKGKYVWQRPNKIEILLTSVVLGLNEEEAFELYDFCGFSLSKYEMREDALRHCLACLNGSDPWANMSNIYRFYTSESIYDYVQDREKIYVDEGEDW